MTILLGRDNKTF